MKVVKYLRGIKISAGFTLMELIISMGILMVLISILMTVFGQILDVQLESKATSTVDQNGRYIMSRLIHDMQRASSITTPPTAGQQTNTLLVVINSIDYTYSLDSNGNLVLTNSNGSENINNYDANISALTFKRLGNNDSNDNVQVTFTVSSRTQKASGTEQKTFQTTVGRQ